MNKSILFATALLVGLTACKKDPLDSIPAELTNARESLAASFTTLNNDMAGAASYVASNINDTAAIRTKMLELFNKSIFAVEFAFISPQGIMQVIEPSVYHPSQGADISGQAHVIKAFQTKAPVLSSTFLAVEGFYAAVDIHPVIGNGQVLGGITCLFLPETIFNNIMIPLLKDQSFELWAMEKGGTMLYNQDADEIGRNIFTDALYQPFPELIAAANRIADEAYGETTYSYFKTGTTNVVVKKTYWLTYSLFGMEWKLVWVKPE